jgi:hypothetical protein
MRWLARLLLLRILPRRLLPILTAWEAFRFLRNARARRGTTDEATRSTHGPAARRPPVR